jgi:prefoldin alpha subunit
MVPLTSSLYVPGILADDNCVLIEAGAGYFIERPIDKAIEYLDRKQKTL